MGTIPYKRLVIVAYIDALFTAGPLVGPHILIQFSVVPQSTEEII